MTDKEKQEAIIHATAIFAAEVFEAMSKLSRATQHIEIKFEKGTDHA